MPFHWPVTLAKDSLLCTQQIDNVLVSYTVGKSEHNIDERSEGSGAEDVVVVHTISFIR